MKQEIIDPSIILTAISKLIDILDLETNLLLHNNLSNIEDLIEQKKDISTFLDGKYHILTEHLSTASEMERQRVKKILEELRKSFKQNFRQIVKMKKYKEAMMRSIRGAINHVRNEHHILYDNKGHNIVSDIYGISGSIGIFKRI